LEKAESYIEEMKVWDDKKLSKQIDLFRKQMKMAYDQGNHEAFELLQEYERLILESRMSHNFGE
jgi:hypothetical protein